LPAPLAPSTAKIASLGTVRVTPTRAWTWPYRTLEDSDAVAQAHRDLHIVLNQHNGHPLFSEASHQRTLCRNLTVAQPREGFVQEHDEGAASQRPGDLKTPQQPQREVPRDLGLVTGQIGERQELSCGRDMIGAVVTAEERPPSGAVTCADASEDVLEHRQLAEGSNDLEGPADPATCDVGGSTSVEPLAIKSDLPRRRRKDRGQEVEERRLAGPIGSDDANDLAARDVKVDAVDRRQSAEPLGQSADAQQ
jgi:hypothetical protein